MKYREPETIPVRFDFTSSGELVPEALTVDESEVKIRGISDQWYDEKIRYFKVTAEDGHRYVLGCRLADLTWTLVDDQPLDA